MYPTMLMPNEDIVISTHNGCFFSCCSVKLNDIINYINVYSKLPTIIDSSRQFALYKNNSDDITFNYFTHYNDININKSFISYIHYNLWAHQFTNYINLDYKNINPIIKKYFSPSDEINNIITFLNTKYIINYNNICVLFYRGNDKNTETKISNYSDYLEYANNIYVNNPNIIFLIQSDETEFIEFMRKQYPLNSFYFKDEIRHINKCNNSVDIIGVNSENYIFSKKYLAITIIMSKCKYIICGSGNCSMWIMFYRTNNKNVCQYLNDEWYSTIQD